MILWFSEVKIPGLLHKKSVQFILHLCKVSIHHVYEGSLFKRCLLCSSTWWLGNFSDFLGAHIWWNLTPCGSFSKFVMPRHLGRRWGAQSQELGLLESTLRRFPCWQLQPCHYEGSMRRKPCPTCGESSGFARISANLPGHPGSCRSAWLQLPARQGCSEPLCRDFPA